jgi:ferredoxin
MDGTEPGLRIEVVPALCRAHAKCSAVAPELFEHDEFGFPWTRHDEIPADLAEKARKAVYACPSKALMITIG